MRNKRNKLFACIIAILCVTLSLGLFACTSDNDNSGDAQATLTLDKTSYTLEKNDTFTLTPTLTGSTEKITWETDAPAVATVNNGTVTAVGAGSAVITAKAGKLSATCAVTVTDSQYFPVLTLSKKTITIATGNEFPVTATVTYKGEAVECDVQWSSSAETVATVENGVIKGIGEGTAVITAKAEYKGEKLEETVTVTVNEDSSITLNKSAVTVYTACPEGKDYATSETLTATIVDCGSEGDAATVVWNSKNAQIATVAAGVITAVGEGETTVTAKYVTESGKELTATVTVTVVIPVVETGAKIEHDLSTGNIVLDVNELLNKTAGEVKRVTLNGEAIEFTATTDNVITLAATTYGDKTVAVYFEDLAYSVNVSAVTKAISTAAELAALKDYCTVTDLGSNKKSYDGYFVLKNDIDFKGGHFTAMQGLVDRADDYGFIGIFDGRGHVITNVAHSGEQWMFGIVGAKAVIRNVGFVNASLSGRNAGLFGIRVHGLVENTFFIGEGHGRSNWTGAFASIAHGSFKNSFVYIKDDGVTAGSVGAFAGEANAKLNFENCFAVSSFALIGNDGTNNSVLTNSAKAETLLAFKSGDYDLTAFSADYWQTADGIPCFKAYSQILKGIAISGGAAEMYAGDKYEFTANFESTFKSKTDIENVTVSPDGTVTVSKDYNGNDTLTLVATSVFDSSATAEYNVTLAAARRVEVEGVYNIELANEQVTLTLENVEGDVTKVLDASGNEITYSVDGKNLVFDKASLKAGGYGARRVSVVTADAIYDYNVVVISKIITTKTELVNIKTYLDENNKVWNGYILIGADIDMEGGNFTAIQPWANGYANGAYGFKGVIDGQGHLIKNLTVATENQNLTGNLMADGVVRKIGFVNVVMGGNRDLSIVANRSYGHLENIFVVADRTVSSNNRWSGALVALNHSDIKNCVVYLANDAANVGATGQLVGQAEANFDFINCFAVGARKLIGNENGKTVGKTNSIGNRKTVAALISHQTDKTVLTKESDVWDLSTGAPVFKTYLTSLDSIQILGAPTELASEESVTLKSSHWVTYSITAGDVATITAAGVLTANATVAADTEITVRATSQFSADKYVEVKVLIKKSLEKITAEGVYDLETVADGTISYAFDGVVNRIVCGSSEVTFENIEGGIKLTKEAITALGTGTKTLRVMTDTTEYAVTVDVWTKIITTKEEFLNLKSYTAESYSGKTASDDGWKTSYQLMRYDGRFALGANIDLENQAYPTMVGHGGSGGGVSDYGFRGTFDGRGYTVSNLNGFTAVKATYGIFGVIGADAVIKNVAFVNVTISGNNSGLLAMRCHGTIENVYIQGSRTNGGNFSGAVVGLMHGNMKNVFVNVEDSTAAGGAALIGNAEANITFENCYAISSKTELKLAGSGTMTTTKCGVAANEEALKALEGYNVSGYDATYWNVESGIPAFKSKS